MENSRPPFSESDLTEFLQKSTYPDRYGYLTEADLDGQTENDVMIAAVTTDPKTYYKIGAKVETEKFAEEFEAMRARYLAAIKAERRASNPIRKALGWITMHFLTEA